LQAQSHKFENAIKAKELRENHYLENKLFSSQLYHYHRKGADGQKANGPVEDLKGYVVELPKSAKYAQILKNSVAFRETANEKVFLMKTWRQSRRRWDWARTFMKERSPSELMQSLTLLASG